ncbi:peptidase S10 [Novosphingobium sp. AP12]|uniref:S10 family serine carboxypeptidase-like protein n=1 Tax=Novosphingobium sp. AP12 TaxID=1144305 RepID=UPI000271E237|nr:peptidase S10 [Novosphingobium sp. AP12]EJL31615.1 carboxypeptidase C (cathepsin A) [Novosphingobium sp. AP12]
MPSTTARLLGISLSLLALVACQHIGAKDRAEASVCGKDVAGAAAKLGKLPYTTCAGTLEIADDQGAKAADLFYTAYIAKRPTRKPRPIAFVWNGGPGADSRLLQFHALGPKTLHGDALADNAASPLSAADLVFLDPAGTGFSRAASEAAAKRLYSTTGDLAATVRFIRAFLKAHGREHSPVYLVGESFGTWRAAGVAEALVDAGQPVAGMALVSGGIPMGEERDRALARALTLPNRTATALALGKLDPALAADPAKALVEAESWARAVWYPALAHPEALDDKARAEVVAGLQRYMGLAPSAIDAAKLWVSPRDFRTKLLKAEGKTLGIFDMRQTTPAKDEKAGNAAILDFYRRTLGYGAGQYAGIDGPELPVGNDWQYDQSPITPDSLARAIAGEGPPSASQPWVLRALEKAPALRVFVATGLYDSLNSCAANREAARDFPGALAERIEARCYQGGHMMYEDPAESQQFANHLSAFFRNSSRPTK